LRDASRLLASPTAGSGTTRTVRAVAAQVALGLILVALIAIAVGPALVSASSTLSKVTACSNVNLRTSPSTSATRKTTLAAGVRVTVTATVSGGTYQATCAGKVVSGLRWYRINTINGKSVKSLYGVTYLYGAGWLFVAAPIPTVAKVTACSNVNLRTSPSTSATHKTTLSAAVRVTVTATVSGGTYKATCAGTVVSGSRWYRINSINGKSVKSLYGVTYLYGAGWLFKVPPIVDPPPPPGPTEGIDVSHWQGTIDWATVRAAGKRFVFIKASESTDFVDPNYVNNVAGAKAAGLFVGAYHYADPDTTPGDGAAEADHYLDTAPLQTGDLIPVLDLEVTGGLSATQLQDWVKAYLGRIYERTGVRGMIYMSPAFWRSKVGDSTWFADNGYKVLWIAHWTTASSPDLPAHDWGGNGWTFWQYTSSGSVPGITGRVDLDRFNGTDFSVVQVP
jgi:GH25 family lysozyme M1 (1,4-beta-N-acetylmuramidase)/uncharacterized protein YgiM (DUF1202 family)